MVRAIVVAFVVLAGCNHSSDDDEALPPGFQTSAASLSAQDQANVCVDLEPFPAAYDLSPYPGGREPTGGTFPCLVYDADVGGDGTCCGGDLRVQTCGAGLSCWKPGGAPVGVCSRESFPGGTVCIDVESFHNPDCVLEAVRDDKADCTLAAFCGNGLFQLSCSGATCSCYNYAALIANTLSAGDVCGGNLDGALAAAQAKCNFPNDFAIRHVHW